MRRIARKCMLWGANGLTMLLKEKELEFARSLLVKNDNFMISGNSYDFSQETTKWWVSNIYIECVGREWLPFKNDSLILSQEK